MLRAVKVYRKALETQHILSYLCLIVFLISKRFVDAHFSVSLIAAAFLAIAVMSSVHHAEVVAHKIGESLGTLVLALCVTIIEVGLIVSLMGKSGPESAVLARDTVFAAVMIITNGMVAICLILGGLRYKEQEFQVQGSKSLFVVLLTLAMIVFILPNFTTTTAGPTYSIAQLIFIAVICLLIYLLFVFFQTKSHKAYFEPMTAPVEINSGEAVELDEVSRTEALLSFISLCISLVAVIGLAKLISPMIEQTVVFIGAPKATVGLFIAVVVLLPETWAAANAARANRLQTSLNLALGSGVASIALTIPVVIAYSLMNGMPLDLGLDPKNMVFLLMTILVGTITLGTGKSTLLQGSVHAVILFTYFFMSFVP